ncbi:MAG: putative acetyl-CoA acyltransferase [Conexibacter sp.]|nr:putative acetyl-CoA acyltransferase [Conexibacter sp.]
MVVAAARTPLGRRDRGLASVHPTRLLGRVQRAVLASAGVEPEAVGQVLGGCVGQVGEQSFNIARTAWLAEGLPESVASSTLDAQCGSSQQALTLATALVGAGLVDLALACGVESMSRIPIGANFRKEHELGRPIPPAYLERYEFLNQYQAAERIAGQWGVTREQADALGLRSQQRAAAAWSEGRFDSQIVPVPVASDDGEQLVRRDEGLRETSAAALAALTPMVPDGVHTAGSASQISDGASAVLLASERAVERFGLRPLARIVDTVTVGVDPVTMLLGPHAVTPSLLADNGLTIDDIDVVEINEAFASIVLSWMQDAGADPERVNPNGGAIALGHPLGATGCVLVTKAVHELQRSGGRYGLVTMCCGGGLGTGTIVERLT